MTPSQHLQVKQHLQAQQHVQAQQHMHARRQRELSQDRTVMLELLDRALDKGVLIEGRGCVPVLGIELLTMDFRAFVASCETYLQYAHVVTGTVNVRELHDVEHERSSDQSGPIGIDIPGAAPDAPRSAGR